MTDLRSLRKVLLWILLLGFAVAFAANATIVSVNLGSGVQGDTLGGTSVPIRITAVHPDGDSVSVELQYQVNGSAWQSGSWTHTLLSTNAGADTVWWNSLQDLGYRSTLVRVRVREVESTKDWILSSADSLQNFEFRTQTDPSCLAGSVATLESYTNTDSLLDYTLTINDTTGLCAPALSYSLEYDSLSRSRKSWTMPRSIDTVEATGTSFRTYHLRWNYWNDLPRSTIGYTIYFHAGVRLQNAVYHRQSSPVGGIYIAPYHADTLWSVGFKGTRLFHVGGLEYLPNSYSTSCKPDTLSAIFNDTIHADTVANNVLRWTDSTADLSGAPGGSNLFAGRIHGPVFQSESVPDFQWIHKYPGGRDTFDLPLQIVSLPYYDPYLYCSISALSASSSGTLSCQVSSNQYPSILKAEWRPLDSIQWHPLPIRDTTRIDSASYTISVSLPATSLRIPAGVIRVWAKGDSMPTLFDDNHISLNTNTPPTISIIGTGWNDNSRYHQRIRIDDPDDSVLSVEAVRKTSAKYQIPLSLQNQSSGIKSGDTIELIWDYSALYPDSLLEGDTPIQIAARDPWGSGSVLQSNLHITSPDILQLTSKADAFFHEDTLYYPFHISNLSTDTQCQLKFHLSYSSHFDPDTITALTRSDTAFVPICEEHPQWSGTVFATLTAVNAKSSSQLSDTVLVTCAAKPHIRILRNQMYAQNRIVYIPYMIEQDTIAFNKASLLYVGSRVTGDSAWKEVYGDYPLSSYYQSLPTETTPQDTLWFSWYYYGTVWTHMPHNRSWTIGLSVATDALQSDFDTLSFRTYAPHVDTCGFIVQRGSTPSLCLEFTDQDSDTLQFRINFRHSSDTIWQEAHHYDTIAVPSGQIWIPLDVGSLSDTLLSISTDTIVFSVSVQDEYGPLQENTDISFPWIHADNPTITWGHPSITDTPGVSLPFTILKATGPATAYIRLTEIKPYLGTIGFVFLDSLQIDSSGSLSGMQTKLSASMYRMLYLPSDVLRDSAMFQMEAWILDNNGAQYRQIDTISLHAPTLEIQKATFDRSGNIALWFQIHDQDSILDAHITASITNETWYMPIPTILWGSYGLDTTMLYVWQTGMIRDSVALRLHLAEASHIAKDYSITLYASDEPYPSHFRPIDTTLTGRLVLDSTPSLWLRYDWNTAEQPCQPDSLVYHVDDDSTWTLWPYNYTLSGDTVLLGTPLAPLWTRYGDHTLALQARLSCHARGARLLASTSYRRLPADYDWNNQLDLLDLDAFFTARLSGTDSTYEMAPLSGDWPNWTIAPDHQFDVQDGLGFSMAWGKARGVATVAQAKALVKTASGSNAINAMPLAVSIDSSLMLRWSPSGGRAVAQLCWSESPSVVAVDAGGTDFTAGGADTVSSARFQYAANFDGTVTGPCTFTLVSRTAAATSVVPVKARWVSSDGSVHLDSARLQALLSPPKQSPVPPIFSAYLEGTRVVLANAAIVHWEWRSTLGQVLASGNEALQAGTHDLANTAPPAGQGVVVLRVWADHIALGSALFAR